MRIGCTGDASTEADAVAGDPFVVYEPGRFA
jgi:hypothetical protein